MQLFFRKGIMPKFVKYLAIAAAVLLSLLIVAAAIIAATFNPNDYKPTIIKLVQEKKQRMLAIPGDIKLTFFPRLGADLGKVSISEHNSKAEFASIDSAKVSLQLIPLLSKQLVVDHVRIDGLNANIRRNKNGSTNFDDLLSEEESPQQQQVGFDIDGVSITNANIRFDDQMERRTLEIAKLNLQTGKIANGVSSKLNVSADVKSNNPVVDANLSVDTGFMIDLERKHYVLKGADAQIKGKLTDFTDLVFKLAGDADLKPDEKRIVLDGIKLSASGKRDGNPLDMTVNIPALAITDTKVSGGKLTGEAKMTDGGRTVASSFSAPSFEGSPQAFSIPALNLDVAVRQADLDAKAKISGAIAGNIDKLLFSSPQLKLALSGKQGNTAIDGSLATPFSIDLKAQTIDLPNIAAAFTLPNPGGGALKFNADGRAGVNLDKQTLSAALKGKFDESAFDAKFGMSNFSPAAYTFDIGIDRLDADRYQAKRTEEPKTAQPEQPIDLSALRDLRAAGSLRIGALKTQNIKASNVRLDLRAAGGKLDVSPLSANLYGGSANGSLSATAVNPPRFAVRQNLTGVEVGPLLKDAIGKDPIEGRGNVTLDVTAGGATFTQLRKNLNGTARLELRDGAVRGINVAQTVRTAKAKIGEIRGKEPAQTGTGSSAEKTDFSELTGSFRIANGVARNDDLDAKSPLIRVSGSGIIDLGEERVDYLARTTVVSTLKGQGGPELEAMKGLTVPVRLSGPFTAIGYRVDFEGLATELAKKKIDEKKDEIKEKVHERLEDKLKGLFNKR